MDRMDFSRQIIHDSAKQKFRSPMGAVPAGTTVTLRAAVWNLYFEKLYLTVVDGTETVNIEMYQKDGLWEARYKVPAQPSVLWYWFCVKLSEEDKIYYGARNGQTSGVGMAYWDMPPAFQITVFDEAFTTPNWLKNANMYQIFPDRFARREDGTFEKGMAFHQSMGRDVYVHEDWKEQPLYRPLDGREHYEPCDYYGGNFGGIIDSLDYLRDMGITALYLNPVVEAASNHRYNTGDYQNADPVLGTNEQFEELARAAQQHGIRLILDGVYSHTGDDSVYFNRYGHYDSVGAFQSKDSPYYPWYQFTDYPEQYKSWWGFTTLPEVDETQPDWGDFVIEADDSVMNTWLSRGAAGYRLDVADELPDETIEKMRSEIKHASMDHALIGEVWEDATTKQSYGKGRTYALGRGLDSVMNYPLVNGIVDFLTYRHGAGSLRRLLVGQSQNYPKEMYYCLMNLLSSHDIARIRTVLATRVDAHALTREQQAHFVVSDEQDRQGAALQRMAAAIQFTLPGAPCIYYGDETGMHGLLDPFNRGPFERRDEEMQEYYKLLANLRARTDALRTGHCVVYSQGTDVIGILRLCVDGKDAFGNMARDGMYLTLVNRADEPRAIGVDLFAQEQLMPDDVVETLREFDFRKAVCVLTGETFPINAGLVEARLPAKSVRILEVDWV